MSYLVLGCSYPSPLYRKKGAIINQIHPWQGGPVHNCAGMVATFGAN